MAKFVKLDEDDTRDIAIRIVDKLVELGIIKDCLDTDDEDEFDTQDAIDEVLTEANLFKENKI
jgi:hypothetical protein